MRDQRPHTADEFLRSVREARVEARRCEQRLDEIRAQCERITPNYGPLLPGGGDDHHDALLIAATEQARTLYDRRQELLWQINLVEAFISELSDARLRSVLRLRYVDCMRWEDVVKGMRVYGYYYDLRHVTRLHGRALNEARKAWDGWAERNSYKEDMG